MKKKNGDEKNEDFFYCTKNVDFHDIKTSNLANSKYVIRFLIPIVVKKIWSFKVPRKGQKMGKIDKIDPL